MALQAAEKAEKKAREAKELAEEEANLPIFDVGKMGKNHTINHP